MFRTFFPVTTGESSIDGLGVFAGIALEPGQAVFTFEGTRLNRAEFFSHRESRKYSDVAYDAIQIDDEFHLVDKRETLHVNHSCDSNLWMSGPTTYSTRRAVAAGEELTVDYALLGDVAARLVPGDCRCGTSYCRSEIRGDDWNREELQSRYAGGFTPFLARRIAAGAQSGRARPVAPLTN
ncbi:SET domain-containing protein-lysine N-methyltransferase [Streptomyces sp. MUM 2J]|uniref:SET domain-containing protein-lysine N-methyltransferase n=1 Tax=Streptomyces sp. MUM 2J TaxID=2791987 RepID=UPI001F045C24|nr:SET domain-containing protein [Streptomyces sp. MUM 2J]MCH0566174.1 SET domain-containing protein [Streptomyces sp. MUM 2J]